MPEHSEQNEVPNVSLSMLRAFLKSLPLTLALASAVASYTASHAEQQELTRDQADTKADVAKLKDAHVEDHTDIREVRTRVEEMAKGIDRLERHAGTK